jgi:hypothetical protein
MVPKWDQGKRYASKWNLPLYCLVATKQEKKPATGQVMVQARGQELRRITQANWRFFGEDGLAGEEVSVWMYEGMLKIEYQATALSEYALHFSPDHKQIEAVNNPRRIETHFRSPQLHLWQTSEAEWLLACGNPNGTSKKSGEWHLRLCNSASLRWIIWGKIRRSHDAKTTFSHFTPESDTMLAFLAK